MSGHSDALKHDFSSTEVREPQDRHRPIWMGHWKQTGCSSAPTIPKEISKEEQDSSQRHSQVHTMKSKEVTTMNADVNPDNISTYKDMQIPDRGGLQVKSDTYGSAEGMIAGKGRVEIMNEARTRENTKSFDAEMMLPKISVDRRQSTSLDWKSATSSPILYSGNVSSGRLNFTALDADRKMGSILAAKKRTGYGATASYRSSSHQTLMELTSAPKKIKPVLEDCQFQEEGMAQNSSPCKFLKKKGLPYPRHLGNDMMGSTSGSAFKGFIQRPFVRSSYMCTGEENVHTFSAMAYKEQFTMTNYSHQKHEVCDSSRHSTFMFSRKESDEKISLGSSWSRLKDGSLKLHGDSQTGDLCCQMLRGQRGSGTQKVSAGGLLPGNSSSIAGLNKLTEFLHERNLPHRVPARSMHDIETLRICTTVDSGDRSPGVLQKLLKTTKYALITKNTDMDLSEGGQTIRETTLPAKSKENAFFEQSTLPPRYCCCGGPLGNYIIDKKEKDDICNSPSFVGIQNESSVKTDSMDIDVCQATRSPAGAISSKSDKDLVGGQNIEGSEFISASSIKNVASRNPETELLDMKVEFTPLLDTLDSFDHGELSTSRTESLDTEHIPSNAEKPERSNSNFQLERHLDTEPSSRWVKRLRLNSDSLAIGTKSSNVEDALTSGRVHKLFSRVMNYSRSNSFTLAKCLREHQQFEKTMVLLRNGDSSAESFREPHSWIQRWCRGTQETGRPQARQPVQVLCEPENTKAVPENFEGKLFPSLAGMALMGKSVSNFRPCEFRKRGSSVVWNTEGF